MGFRGFAFPPNFANNISPGFARAASPKKDAKAQLSPERFFFSFIIT